jgi:RHS repeat-associated protein
MIGMVTLRSDSVTTRYFHTDNLGSIAVITNESGVVVERDSYDAWGKRRFPNGADDPSGSIESQTTRGFTGQEELADVGLVHLNGRVYDPLIGRMMSADPFVPDPLNAQAWNRYSYVINNPLAFTDPNGYCFLGMCSWGKGISKFFNHAFRGLRLGPSIIGDLVEILAVAFCPFDAGLSCVVPAAFMSTTFVAGVTSGNLGYALKAGLIAGVTAIANFEVGLTAKGLGGVAGDLFNAAGHAAVGCASAAASGGKCGAGALAAGIPALAGPVINGNGYVADLVTNAVVGGLASAAGGGKFANGAVTAAFAYAVGPSAGQSSSDPNETYDPNNTYGAGEGSVFKFFGLVGVIIDSIASSVALNDNEPFRYDPKNVANMIPLKDALKLQSTAWPFDESGSLTNDAIAHSKEIIAAGDIGNLDVPRGFSKYSTQTYQSLSGDFQVHFYYNAATKQPYYGLDYKVKFN